MRKTLTPGVAIICFLVLVAFALIPIYGSRYLIDLFNEIMIYMLFALSLNVLIGFSGNVSFGHAAYFAIGGYTCAILLTTYQWPLIPSFIVACSIQFYGCCRYRLFLYTLDRYLFCDADAGIFYAGVGDRV